MSAYEITLTSARRVYDGVAAVNDVSLTAPEGKVLALLGASGSGKSTILRLIAGLEPLDGGSIRFGDQIVATQRHSAPPEARRIGIVFQDYALFPHLTAAANIMFGLDKLSRDNREREARAWLARVGLERRANAYPHELSGGEQQRVALARALAPRPFAVLLDEPFSGLDPVLRADLREMTLAALREAGATAIFVTHDAEEALYVADEIAILKAGKLLQSADPRTLYDRPISADAAAALGPVNIFGGVVTGAKVVTPFGAISTDLPEGTSALAVVRAEAITLSSGIRARVSDKHPQGGNELLRIEADGVVWRTIASARTAPAIGARVDVAIDNSGAFVFAR
ncbi:MAG: ABC transporter ATP-binding protein [Hyphomonadaceae bacterium]